MDVRKRKSSSQRQTLGCLCLDHWRDFHSVAWLRRTTKLITCSEEDDSLDEPWKFLH